MLMLSVVSDAVLVAADIDEGDALAANGPGVAVRVIVTETSTVAVSPKWSVIVQRAVPVLVCGKASPDALNVVLCVAALVILIPVPPLFHTHAYEYGEVPPTAVIVMLSVVIAAAVVETAAAEGAAVPESATSGGYASPVKSTLPSGHVIVYGPLAL